MILRRTMIPALALLVALSTVTLLYYSGVARAPAAFIGDDDTLLLTPPSGGLTSTGVISGTLAEVLRLQPGVDKVSPEIFVPTSVGGRSVIVRGVEMEAFLELERGRLTSGRLAVAEGEAVAGRGFASVHSVGVGDDLVIPGSLANTVLVVKVVGIFDSRTAPRDELLVPLSTARQLAGLSTEGVHLLRVDASNKTAIGRLIDSVSPVFIYSGVSISDDDALVGDTITVRANVTNWGAVGGTKVVELFESGRLVATQRVYVPPRAVVPIVVPYKVDRSGDLNITLNPSFHVRASAQSATFEAASIAPLGGPFPVRLRHLDGAPYVGAELSALGERVVTDDAGLAILHPPAYGEYEIRARAQDVPIAMWRGFVVAAQDVSSARLVVVSLSPTATLVRWNETVGLNVTLANVGGLPDDLSTNVTVDGIVVGAVRIPLDPSSQGTSRLDIGPFPVGIHEVTVEGEGPRVFIESIDGDPAVEALLRANRRSAEAPPALPEVDAGADDYIARVVGNVRLAVIVLSIVSAGLASLGAFAVIGRHLADRAPSLGLLKAIGADREYVLRVVTREAAIHAAWASVLGILAGCLVALAMDSTGYLRAFGHAVRPRYDPYVLLLLAGGTVLLAAVAARLITSAAFARPVDQLLRGETIRAGSVDAPALDELLGGSR